MRKRPQNVHLALRRLHADDWSWMQRWYCDEWINRELGPIDFEWLQHILTLSDGVHLVADQDHRPAGIIGIQWATVDYPYHAITDLVVDPDRRTCGLGKAILEATIHWCKHPPASKWVAHIALENKPPVCLLKSLGWTEVAGINGMRQFTYHL